MNLERKSFLFFGIRLLISVALAVWAECCQAPWREILYIIAFLCLSLPSVSRGMTAFSRKDFFEEHVLCLIIGVFLFCMQQFFEALLISFLFQVIRYLKNWIIQRAQSQVKVHYQTDISTINLLEPDGTVRQVEPEEIQPGDCMVVQPGEYFLVDARVLSGQSQVNTLAITAENAPVNVGPGDEVLAGYINLDAPLNCQVTDTITSAQKSFDLALVSYKSKSRTQRFIYHASRKISLVFAVVGILSFLLSLFPQIDTWYAGLICLFAAGMYTVQTFVVQGLFCGIYHSAGRGILFKEGDALEKTAEAEQILIFQKDLAQVPQITSLTLDPSFSKVEVSSLAGMLATHSAHPFLQAVTRFTNEQPADISQWEETPGKGISGVLEGKQVLLGSTSFLKTHKVRLPYTLGKVQGVHCAVNGEYAGCFLYEETELLHYWSTLQQLQQKGTHSLTVFGEYNALQSQLLQLLGISDYTNQTAEEQKKLAHTLCQQKNTLVVGYESVPLTGNVRLALGCKQLDKVMPASDVLVAGNSFLHVLRALTTATFTMRMINWNFGGLLALKVLFVILAFFHLLSLPIAFLLEAVAFCVVMWDSREVIR